MQQLPAQLTASFERRLDQAHVPPTLHQDYHNRWIGWNDRERAAGLNRLTNNTRFLIPRWVHVHGLAIWGWSRVRRRLVEDWRAKYGHGIELVETFMDRSRFRGCCYAASNWVEVGLTQGRSRGDLAHRIQVGEDTCEKLVKLPIQYEVPVHVYPQMACQRGHEGVTSAPRQDHRLKADVSVIADVVVKKYVEHQPLFRQQQAYDRLEIPISPQTLLSGTPVPTT
jgi:hypothetical protein